MSMTSFETAGRPVATREDDRAMLNAELSSLSRLRPRAQFVRLGNRCALPSLGGGYVYFVAKGVVGIETGVAGSDVRVITSLLYPGDVLVPELQAPLASVSLTSQRPCEFWKLTPAVLGEEASRDGHLWHAIFGRLNDQNARMQLHAAEMSILNSEEKVAGFLIETGARSGISSGGSIAFELPLSRYSIADYLSLNADTISRTFSALATARIIERRGRFQIVVRDWHALLAKCPMSEAIVAAHGAGKPQLSR
ncbi:Crp/Fnr family transcriptional regulator [Hyphomicrobium sp.]|uniref:Crp/Fnr family transcriptional regulator n=1 Tax=Hyphomicrobium sp. TaxID=82 RepID=UPI0025BA8747|nr:Crp/Fnr family transcriptional regulator [Hyphomicrobium sp.]